MIRTLPLFLVSLSLSSLALSAKAQDVAETNPETGEPFAAASTSNAPLTARPFVVGLGVGGAFGLNNGGAAFSIEENFGYRFFDFALSDSLDAAIWAGLSFGQEFGDSFYVLQFDARGGVDFEVFDNGELQILATPSLALGGGVVGVTGAFGSTNGAFDLQISAQGELVLLDGLLGIWLRPLSFEFLINNGTGVRYEVLAGANFRF